jgi:phenylacetate-coenzyme A ligase PaaK-like adenylate-forming protein
MSIGSSRFASIDSGEIVNERLRELVKLHFHPAHGSAYWLRREAENGMDARDRIQTLEDLWLFGPMPISDLQRYPVRDFIPRLFHSQLADFVIGETAGTSQGQPCTTAYRADEFQAAFITPFLKIAQATGFPREVPWLWIGPSGPHIIGKAVRELARQTGCMDPFSIDFDPRWAKRLTEGSTARHRYLQHITEQALDIIHREEIAVLFTTPPVLNALAEKMTSRERERVLGVHYGGMSLSPESVNEFKAAFPNAVHLAGYGNTLFGVVMEVFDGYRLSMDYYPLDERVQFQVVAWSEELPPQDQWPPKTLPVKQAGRVLFHRLDESILLIGVLERDQAEMIAPCSEARALGGCVNGLRNPGPVALPHRQIQLGLY